MPDPAERASLHQHILANGISYRDDSIMVDGYFSGTSDRFTVRSPEFFADAYRLTPTVLELEHYGKVKSLGNWEARPDSAAFKFGKGKSRARTSFAVRSTSCTPPTSATTAMRGSGWTTIPS